MPETFVVVVVVGGKIGGRWRGNFAVLNVFPSSQSKQADAYLKVQPLCIASAVRFTPHVSMQ